MKFVDRLLTIVVTTTLTSAAWIMFLSVYPATFGAGAVTAGNSTPNDRPDQREGTALLIPVAGVTPNQLIDSFSDERGGGVRLHKALDIMAPKGTPVLAAAAGTVEKLGSSDSGGKSIYVRSVDRKSIHYYAHLDGYSPELAEGRKVHRGEQLGTVGSTGNASPDAPHLHFEIMRTALGAEWWEPSTAINPYPLLHGS